MNDNLFVPAFTNPAGSPIRELFPYLGRPGMISFAGGYPSPSLFDTEGLRASAARVMSQGAGFLQYGATEGSPLLKEELLKLSSSRGIAASQEQLLVTTGSQQAFDLLVRIFVQPGDSVLLETPAYPAAIQALRLAGANLLEVPMDSQGLQVHALAAQLQSLPANQKPKLLYTVPTFSNPRGTLLPDWRRAELVQLAQRHGFLIVEDEPYGELAFTDERPAPVYVHGARSGGDNPVIYLASLSKTVAPALRVGWMIAAPEVVRRSAIAKQTSDLCTSPVTQLIAADYLHSGRYPATVQAACNEYRRRAEAMAQSLEDSLGDVLRFEKPAGGMFLWAESAVRLDAKALFQSAVDEGVLFVPGAAFHPTKPVRDSMRLSFAAPTVEQIAEGVARLARAFRKQPFPPPSDPMTASTSTIVNSLLDRLRIADRAAGGKLAVVSPVDGSQIAAVRLHSAEEAAAAIGRAQEAFNAWRNVPAPRRGELIRVFGDELRNNKEALGQLVAVETGKILSEGLGEVQEMIDICDFALGLSRQLYGLTIASERPGHRMMESWHPLGVVGVISAFNFPAAVWAWNFALAIVCGDSVVWKPSEKTPLTALACQAIFENAVKRFGDVPAGLSEVVIGKRDVGEVLVDDHRIALLSATGSTRMGREVGPRVAARFGRSLLELGGNNAVIVTPSADLDLAIRGIAFAAAGTCGQRCTTTRRLIVHGSMKEQLVERLKKVFGALVVGNPLEQGVLVGPLVDGNSFEAMQNALRSAKEEGGQVTGGERLLQDKYASAYYVRPAIVEMPAQTDTVRRETFAPILYVLTYENFEDALKLHNEVPQGLSSAIFSNDVRESETFLSARGSDCGIANVNIGTSGAEIGGAFGGEKETGGGRESGSDAWRNYMRRATNTVNYSRELPLAQGVRFDV